MFRRQCPKWLFCMCDSHKQTRQRSQLCNLSREACGTRSHIKPSSIVRASRYFCYSLHCLLGPLWSDQVQKTPVWSRSLLRGCCALAGFFPIPGGLKIPHLEPTDAFKMHGTALEFLPSGRSLEVIHPGMLFSTRRSRDNEDGSVMAAEANLHF